MAGNRESKFSSPFDEMLEENWKKLDELYRGANSGREGQDWGASATPARSRPNRAPSPRPPLPTSADRPRTYGSGTSDAVRFLNDRYGDGWSYQVSDRRRDGDEVVVLCKLSIPEQNISKSQFGRARIAAAGASSGIAGTADGVSFTLGDGGGAAADAGDPEQAAYRRAVDDALAKCVELL